MDTGHGLIAWIIIGVVAGWLTGKLMKGSGYGFWMDMIVGLIGALGGRIPFKSPRRWRNQPAWHGHEHHHCRLISGNRRRAAV
jgi:uncharacterized membrane protein YeaQ/YmgE (transglycosylase-associated protein family)